MSTYFYRKTQIFKKLPKERKICFNFFHAGGIHCINDTKEDFYFNVLFIRLQ